LTSVPERDLVGGVVQLANLLTKKLAPLFEKAGVTPQQWAVLTTLAEAPEAMTLVGIAREMLVSKQNMTGMIARLEQLGLVERGDDSSDLRSWRVHLTRRGRSTVEKLRPAYREWLEHLAEGAEMEALQRSVTRLIDVLSVE
jgi:DNA-binding MarR family transcriptional regulator